MAKAFKSHWKSNLVSALGIFFLFSTLGFALDVMKMGRQPVLRLWLSVLLFGGFAVCYATAGYVFRKRWRKTGLVVSLILARISHQ